LNPTVASWAIAAEAKMSIDPAARANCKDLASFFLRKRAPAGVGSWGFSINRDDSACAKTHPGTVAGRAYAFDADGGLLLDARRLLVV
jgi:hypothetical protein